MQNAARLKSMRDRAERIEIRVGGNAGSKLELGPEPLIRWDNPRAHVPDGAAFVWVEKLLPQAIGGIWIKNGHTLFELHSLSQQPLNAAAGRYDEIVDVPAGNLVAGHCGRTSARRVSRNDCGK